MGSKVKHESRETMENGKEHYRGEGKRKLCRKCDLNKNGPQRLIGLKICSLLGGTVWEHLAGLVGVALLWVTF